MPGRWCGRATRGRWASRTHWASPYSLGKPVLVGRTRTHWASPYSLGEPSNEVGRASTKGPLGEPVLVGKPVLIGRAINSFHSGQACACLALCLLGTASACSARLLACLARYLSACSAST